MSNEEVIENEVNKNCPSCGEEVKEVAVKCKHCHAVLNADEGKVGGFFVGLIVMIVVFYVGGWSIVWNEPLGLFALAKDFLFEYQSGMAFRVDSTYYGFVFENRFFDSPVISWLCLGAIFAPLFSGGFFFYSSGNSEA